MKIIKKAIANIILWTVLPTATIAALPSALEKVEIIKEARQNILDRVS